jgi:hypothetical protein
MEGNTKNEQGTMNDEGALLNILNFRQSSNKREYTIAKKGGHLPNH